MAMFELRGLGAKLSRSSTVGTYSRESAFGAAISSPAAVMRVGGRAVLTIMIGVLSGCNAYIWVDMNDQKL